MLEVTVITEHLWINLLGEISANTSCSVFINLTVTACLSASSVGSIRVS